jgi:hypothetical protein
MSQNRDPPAYIEYAANMMAKLEYRIMSLSERGLLYSMRNECWVNYRLPSNPTLLAKVLGCNADEVSKSLEGVMPFFEVVNDYIISPELEFYRAYLAEIRAKQSAGGEKGAKIANQNKEKARKVVDTGSQDSQVDPEVDPRVLNLNQSNLIQPLSLDKAVITEPFIVDYEATENNNKRIHTND